MRKIIFIDVDGTLVNYENVLPDSAVEVIRSARQQEHKVYICTGRSRAEVYENIWNIGLSPRRTDHSRILREKKSKARYCLRNIPQHDLGRQTVSRRPE